MSSERQRFLQLGITIVGKLSLVCYSGLAEQKPAAVLSTKLSPANSQLGNCSSQQLRSWFPRGVSRSHCLWESVGYTSRCGLSCVWKRCVLGLTQACWWQSYISAWCLPRHDDWNALIQGLFRSDQNQKFWTLDGVVKLIIYSIGCKPIYLFIFSFLRLTSTDNTYVNFLKVFSMGTRAFQSLGGLSTLSVSLPLKQDPGQTQQRSTDVGSRW